MSIRPMSADLLARLAYVASPVMTRVAKEVRFPEVRMASTERVGVRTRAGVVECTIYRPAAPAADGRPLPLLVNFHGGGFILGNPAQDDHICRYLAHHTPCVVVNVDYTTAPFARYPTQIHQGYDVVRHLVEHPEGWDAVRVAVLGHSAGGMLVAALAMMARDEGGPNLKAMLLDYPGTDMFTPPSSRKAWVPDPGIPIYQLEISQQVYCPDPARRGEALASPVMAPDLSGLPPALVIAAERDILRDEATLYARRLAEAGTPTRFHLAEGVDHAFTSHHLERTLEAFGLMIEHLQAAYRLVPEDSASR